MTGDEYTELHDKWMFRMIVLLIVIFFMLVTMVCVMSSASRKVTELEKRMTVMEKEHKEIAQWIDENKTVMQTYKFFNQSWQAILDKEGIK